MTIRPIPGATWSVPAVQRLLKDIEAGLIGPHAMIVKAITSLGHPHTSA